MSGIPVAACPAPPWPIDDVEWFPPSDPIHAMRGPGEACGNPHCWSHAMNIPRCADCVTMMSVVSARREASVVVSRRTNAISTACA